MQDQQPNPDDYFGSADHVSDLANQYGLRRSSGKRTPQHNAAVGGAVRSYHLTGQAGDYVGDAAAMKAFHDNLKASAGDKLPELLDEGSHIHVAFKGQASKPVTQAKAPDADAFFAEMDAKQPSSFTVGKVGNLTGSTVPQSGSTPPVVKGAAVGGAKKMPAIVLPRRSTEQFLVDEFEKYKTAGNLPAANEQGLRLQKDYGYEFGNQPDDNGTQWPYVKPPAKGLSKAEAYAKSLRPGQGSTAFINRLDAEAEQKRQQEEFARNDQRGVVRRFAEGASRGARQSLDYLGAGVGRLLKDVQEGVGEASRLPLPQPVQDEMARREQPTVSVPQQTAGERIERFYRGRAEEAAAAQALRGQDIASKVGHGIGSTAPFLIPGGGPAVFGIESGLSAYGEGRPLAESILIGAMNARGLQGGHQLGETLAARMQNPFTRLAAKTVGTAAGLETVRAGTGGGIPDTPEAVAHEALTALGFALIGGKWAGDKAARDGLKAMLGDGSIHPDVKAQLESALTDIPITAAKPRLIPNETTTPIRQAEGAGNEQRQNQVSDASRTEAGAETLRRNAGIVELPVATRTVADQQRNDLPADTEKRPTLTPQSAPILLFEQKVPEKIRRGGLADYRPGDTGEVPPLVKQGEIESRREQPLASSTGAVVADIEPEAAAPLSAPPRVVPEDAAKDWKTVTKAQNVYNEPVTVYHGTATDSPIESFDVGRAGTGHSGTTGIWFTDSPHMAAEYAGLEGEIDWQNRGYHLSQDSGESLEFPKDLSKEDFGNGRRMVAAQLDIRNPKVLNASDFHVNYGEANKAVEQAQKEGYDGVIIKDANYDSNGRQIINTHYVVFNPDQVHLVREGGEVESGQETERNLAGRADVGRLGQNRGTVQSEAVNPAATERLQPAPAEGVEHHSQAQSRAEDGTFNGPVDSTAYTPKAERSLPKTLEEGGLEGGNNRTYEPVSNPQALSAAEKIIADKGVDGAAEWVKAETQPSADHTATGIKVIGELQKAGRHDAAVDVASALAEHLTRQGQAIQAVKVINQLSPERALLVAQRTAERAGKNLSLEQARSFAELAERAKAAEGRANDLQTQVDRLTSAKKPKSTRVKATDALRARADTAYESLKARIGKLDLPISRPAERGAVTIKPSGKLQGDAELLAEYGAARLQNTDLAGWKQHMVDTFGEDVKPLLDSIARRSYEIRIEERAKELASRLGDKETKQTAADEIAAEIKKSEQEARKAEADVRRGVAVEGRARTRAERQAERERLNEVAKDARGQADEAKRVAAEAGRLQTAAYRERIATERKQAKESEWWTAPIKEAASEAQKRLDGGNSTDRLADVLDIATARLAPENPTQAVRKGLTSGQFYRGLMRDFGVSKKEAQRVYKQAYQRVEDARGAAREAARIKSASGGEAGAMTDAQLQATLYRHAEAQRQALEARFDLAQEFSRLNRGRGEKIVSEILNTPRSLQSSIDAPLGRQGLMYLVTHPVITVRDVVPEMMRAYKASKATYAQMVRDMEAHPDYELFKRSKGEITETSEHIDPRFKGEEEFQSSIASRLPHVRLSEQAYNIALNLQRLNVFSRYADVLRSHGYTLETNTEAFEQAANLANLATGRGQLPEFLKRASGVLSGIGYAPRLLSSRIQLLNMMVNPRSYMRLDPAVRRIAAGEFVKFAGALALTAAVAQQMGARVSLNPDDGDFLKIRFGKTTYDLTGGLGNVLRFGFRAMRAVAKRVQGEPVADKDDLWEVTKTFVRSKLAPVPGAAINLYAGKDVVGKPANLKFTGGFTKVMNENQLVKMVTPMVVGDFVDAADEEGAKGLAKNLPGLAGFGIQNYLNQPEVQQFYRDYSVTKELAKNGTAADASYFEALKSAAQTLTVLRKERDAVNDDVDKRDALTMKMREVAADALKTKGQIDPGVDAKLKAKKLAEDDKIDEAEDVLDEAVSAGDLSPRVVDAMMKTLDKGTQTYTESAISRMSLLQAIDTFNALPKDKQTDKMIQAIDKKFNRFDPDNIKGRDKPKIDAAAPGFYTPERLERLNALEAQQ